MNIKLGFPLVEIKKKNAEGAALSHSFLACSAMVMDQGYEAPQLWGSSGLTPTWMTFLIIIQTRFDLTHVEIPTDVKVFSKVIHFPRKPVLSLCEAELCTFFTV